VNAPAWDTLPATVIVFAPLLTPVPPYVPETKLPCHTPVAIVPTEVSEEAVTPDARVAPVNEPAGAEATKVPVIVVVEPTDVPMLIVVVEPVVPPVPILIVLANAPVNAAVEILVVETAPVPVYPRVNAVELAKAPNVAPPSIEVVKVGAVPNTRTPDPVSSEITPASSAEVVAAKADNLLLVVATVPVVGKVNEVFADNVKPKLYAPVKVIVFAALLAIPVPPYAGVITEPFQVPEETVPPE